MENAYALDAILVNGMLSRMNTTELFQQDFHTKIISGGITRYDYRTDYFINKSRIH